MSTEIPALKKKKEKYIDIKEAIRKKNPRILKWMPRFLLRWIKRKVHEDEINAIMDKIGHLEGLEFLNAGLKEFNISVEHEGLENIPQTGGVIIACNHPLGGLDGMTLMAAVAERRTDIQFLVNDILLNIENFSSLFVPVNKVGANSKEALKKIESTYASEQAILVFPAGLVSRKQKEGIRDLDWKKSFVKKAKNFQKPIVPVYIDGKNSKFFYNFARWRKRLGIKVNIEMFFLSDEMFKQKDQTIKCTFGPPIPPETWENVKNFHEAAQDIKEKVYKLRHGKNY